MEILFLGTGTSQGVPMIGHVPEGLDLKNPKNWRSRTCCHVVCDGAHLQIDAGPEFRISCLKFGVPAVDFFFLTHEHADHILGMDDLRPFFSKRHGNAIPIFSTKSGVERVKTIFDYGIRENSTDGYVAFSPKIAEKIFCLPSGSLDETTIFQNGKTLSTAGFVFTEKATGTKFAYYTDCAAVPEAALELAFECDVLVLDALRPNPHPTHLSIFEALEIAQKIKAKKTFFVHMTWQIDHETWSARLPENVFLAYDGLKISA